MEENIVVQVCFAVSVANGSAALTKSPSFYPFWQGEHGGGERQIGEQENQTRATKHPSPLLFRVFLVLFPSYHQASGGAASSGISVKDL